MLSERLIEALWSESADRRLICKIVYWVVSINMGLMVYGFAMTDNIWWRASQYVVEKDSALCIRILAALDSIDNFDYANNTVYFFNIVEEANAENTTSLLGIEPDLYKSFTADLETNLWCYDDHSILAHISLYEGVDIKRPDDTILARIGEKYNDIRNDYSDMEYGDFEIFRFEDTDTYIVVTKMFVSYGILENR